MILYNQLTSGSCPDERTKWKLTREDIQLLVEIVERMSSSRGGDMLGGGEGGVVKRSDRINSSLT